MINRWEDFDWNQLSLEQLNLVQSQVSKAISLKKRELKLYRSSQSITQEYSYKASISKFLPHHLRNSLPEYQSCVFIVSLGSKNFCDERLKASIKWISERFTTCIVLVGDSIYRLTLEVMGNNQNEEFYAQAISSGQEFIRENNLLFQEYAQNCNFTFQLTSEVEKQPNFPVYYSQFQQLCQSNQSFATLVNSFADTYLSRIQELNSDNTISLEQQRHLAKTYLLEESALFTCIAEQGLSVFVYPGSIKTFEEIAAGLYSDVPLFLQKIIWVSLRLKKKSYIGSE
ncbi:MAG: tRNA-dependent cyclodipeptide synthase [Sphaerospermopsis sp. SIO1G2]|nr:tRNA-dependent cyclodipeptide synthase [Sphaerospermopsis sp. SIO1G2]